MSSLWVVLDTNSMSDARRIGRVQEADDDAASSPVLTVHWPDGEVERVKLSPRFRKFRLDTLSALAEFAPEQLAQELASSPLPFARALAEKPKVHLRAKELLGLVSERARIDKADVDRAWKAHRKAFELLEQVHVEQTSSGAKYHLRLPLPTLELELSVGELVAGEASDSAGLNVADVVEAAQSAPREDHSSTESSSEIIDGSMEGEVEPEVTTPENIAVALSRRVMPDLDQDTLDAWFASGEPQEAISDGATALEPLRSKPEQYAARVSEFSLLVSRILKKSELSIPASTLARAFVALRRSEVESERRRGLEALDRLPDALTKPADFLSKIDRRAFQAALAELPFSESGPRVKILVALGRSGGAILDDAGWWRGFGWSDILANSTGSLSTILAGSETLMAMTRKIVDETARDVTTRRGLATLLGGPRFALEHVSPAQVNDIFERVAQNDDLLARWVAEISDLAARDDLMRRASDAESEARASKNAESQAREDLDALSRQLAEVQSQLAALQDASAGLSTRERRQVLIDAAKVVAQVAATVEGDGRDLDHDALTRKVTTLAERFGLHAHARPGESVAFEPTRHSAPGTRPNEGEIVNVARAGYTWDDGEERVVVLPALVSRVSGSEESA